MENCWKRNQLSILNENFGVSNVRDVVYLAMFEKVESENIGKFFSQVQHQGKKIYRVYLKYVC
jgi:hypothetical protein